MDNKTEISIFWFRRDLRLADNHALYEALKGDYPVLPIFIFDSNILDELEDRDDARVTFIHQEVLAIKEQLERSGSTLLTRYGEPLEVWKSLMEEFNIRQVYANRDYEPYAIKRDKAVYQLLESKAIKFIGKKDHLIFEKDEVVKKDGSPYTVYTPYSKIWKNQFRTNKLEPYPSAAIDNWLKTEPVPIISLEEMDFTQSAISFPDRKIDIDVIEGYHETRDIPSVKGTSRLSMHLRFGTVSVREVVKHAYEHNEKFLNELIWREFYSAILWHFPNIVNENFNQKYDMVEWRNNEEEFEKWQQGKTGFPIVDAGMRELNETGYMHNRVRMIVACFMTKHLLIDWRWGEAYFARKLLDYELASNNGGWQWAAGTGVDAAPYFRVFNPYTQAEKFDPQQKYIRKWVPEIETADYPEPIVEHKFARERALETYKRALNGR